MGVLGNALDVLKKDRHKRMSSLEIFKADYDELKNYKQELLIAEARLRVLMTNFELFESISIREEESITAEAFYIRFCTISLVFDIRAKYDDISKAKQTLIKVYPEEVKKVQDLFTKEEAELQQLIKANEKFPERLKALQDLEEQLAKKLQQMSPKQDEYITWLFLEKKAALKQEIYNFDLSLRKIMEKRKQLKDLEAKRSFLENVQPEIFAEVNPEKSLSFTFDINKFDKYKEIESFEIDGYEQDTIKLEKLRIKLNKSLP